MSGWIATVGMAIWQVCSYIRNRNRVKVNVDKSTTPIHDDDYAIVINQMNVGRNPVNMTAVGLEIDGHFFNFTQLPQPQVIIELGWLFRFQPKYSVIHSVVLRDTIEYLLEGNLSKQYDIIKGVCFLDEKGNRYYGMFPDSVQEVLFKK